jgi:hypothetical protein
MSWNSATPEQVSGPPQFCPRCQKPGPASGRLCAECGESLVDQGFCHVCERYWRLTPGEPCPKHEIPLEADHPLPHPALEAGAPVDWVTVARFDHPSRAMAPRLRLESEGIPTFLDGERMGTETAYNVATGGVKLQVPRGLLADARILLDQVWSLPEEDEDLDDAYEDLAPEPGARRRAWMRGMIVLILFFPLVYALAAWLLQRLTGR